MSDSESKNESVDSGDKIKEHEELLSFQLRGRLALINFDMIWRVMPKLKWRHSGTDYISPNGENMGSSKTAMETLDAFALSCLGLGASNIHARDDHGHTTASQSAQQMDLHKKWRKELLTEVFYMCKKSGKPLPCFYFDDEDDEQEEKEYKSDEDGDEDDEASSLSKSGKKKKLPATRSVRRNTRSMTANERGTGEYLDNKTRQTKKKDKGDDYVRIAKDDDMDDQDNDNNTANATSGPPKENLKWPNPSDCVERNQRMTHNEKKETKDNDAKWRKRYLEMHSVKWRFLLGTNHSLLLYGFGSKQELMNDFALQLRPHGDVLTICGFDPNVNVGQILDIMVQLFLNGVEPSDSMQLLEDNPCSDNSIDNSNENDVLYDMDDIYCSPPLLSKVAKRAKSIGQAIGAQCTKPVYLVIHNIDGGSMMNDDTQRALALLLVNSTVVDHDGVKRRDRGRVIRLMASMDHVDAPIALWDVETQSNFSWVSFCFFRSTSYDLIPFTEKSLPFLFTIDMEKCRHLCTIL